MATMTRAPGVKCLAAFPVGSPLPQAMGLGSVFILAHIGDTINEYRQLWRWYWPETCPGSGGYRFRRHTGYLHSVGDEPPVPILRFRCSEPGCRQVFTVLPDLLAPYQSQPVAGEERVVLQYAATLGTCSQVAQEAGVPL